MKIKSIRLALVVFSSALSFSSMAENYNIDNDGHFSWNENSDTQVRCEHMSGNARDACASNDSVMDGLNNAVDYMKGYTDTAVDDAKQDIYNYFTANGVDKDYVDAGDVTAKSYADKQAEKAQNEANAYTDSTSKSDRAYSDTAAAAAELSANTYTDGKSEEDRYYTDDKAATAESNANTYTDSEIKDATNDMRSYTDNLSAQTLVDANTYTDSKVTNATNDMRSCTDNSSAQTLVDANTYTDNSSVQTLVDANTYTDNSIIEAKDEMTSYTDNSSKNMYNKAVEYTDSKVQEGNSYAIDFSKNYTDQSSQKTLSQAAAYTDNLFNQAIDYTKSQINTVNGRIDHLDTKIDKNRQKASAGIAGAMAMSSIPQNLSYDFNFGMGMANFDSEQAISAGGYYRVNERTIFSVKASFDTQNNLGAAAGVSYGW